jgi:hypothetical protein
MPILQGIDYRERERARIVKNDPPWHASSSLSSHANEGETNLLIDEEGVKRRT